MNGLHAINFDFGECRGLCDTNFDKTDGVKDVRTHCYCAYLVRTLYMTWHVPHDVFQARRTESKLNKI